MATTSEQYNIPLIGVDSEHCALIVDKQLGKIKGVGKHKVDVNNAQASVSVTDPETLQQAVTSIREIGYDVSTIKKQYPVIGMTCAACASSVESILINEPGILKAGVNFATQTVQVEYVQGISYPAKMKVALQAVGYDLVTDDSEEAKAALETQNRARESDLRMRTWWAVGLSIPLVIIGMFFMGLAYANYIMWAISTPIVLWLGRNFFINAWKQARHRSANMDTLVALSTGIAYIFSVFNTVYPAFWHNRGLHPHVYFEAAGVVIAFILLGKMLEENAKSNTSSAIKKLIGLQPQTATLIGPSGEIRQVKITEVKVDDVLLVKPGERIPLDGLVRDGSTFIDESMISGEPIPVEKKTGDAVFAGTINQKGSLQFIAQKVGGDTLLAGIIRMVQEAQGSKAPVQKLVDRIAGIFVPIVVGIAMLTFIAWIIFGGDNGLTQGLLAMVTVLVIACPCALGLATPTAIMVGVGKGAEHGILIKDAESLETARRVNAIILDKTGTITEGKPVVTALQWASGQENEQHRNLLYTIESASEHPLADAVVNHLKENGRQLSIGGINSLTGLGIEAVYEGETFYVGSAQLMEENDIVIAPSFLETSAKWKAEAKTVIYFANSNEALAVIAIADKIKETSLEAVQTLQRMGVEVFMVTGDNAETAAAVAKQVGIEKYSAQVSPSGKAAFIKNLQAKGRVVAMVGDGINDSLALAEANVSIAMGKGADIAMDVAKMTLIGNDLRKVPAAIKLSQQTVRTIRQNLFWAFIYNIIGIPVAAGILYPISGFLLNPMIAGAAMALSSVSVISNSLRLKWSKLNT